jgi:uncharacterized protein YkvS
MEKVKLTPEQVKGLEKWKEIANTKQILHGFTEENKKYGWLNELECLKSLSFTEMALALCGWYEIEETFKVGDWVTFNDKYTGKVLEVSGESVLTDFKGTFATQRFRKRDIRKSTEEEIAAEKERRKWAAINRSVGDYHKGDIVMFKKHADVVEFVELRLGPYLRGLKRYVSVDEIELICPVDHRFDMKEAE